MNKYYIVNLQGQPLSCFLDNDLVTKNQLRYRKRDCMFFRTLSDAEKTIKRIRLNCKQKKQAMKLRISKDINW